MLHNQTTVSSKNFIVGRASSLAFPAWRARAFCALSPHHRTKQEDRREEARQSLSRCRSDLPSRPAAFGDWLAARPLISPPAPPRERWLSLHLQQPCAAIARAES